MLRVHVLVAAICCGAFNPITALAQGRDMYVPAETPPPSYTAPQYVDSTGCAFMRAGYGGKVEWVPRVTLDRQPVCGMVPSLRAASGTVVAQPALQPVTPSRPPAVVSARPAAPVGPPMATVAGSPAPARPAPEPVQTARRAGCPQTHPYGQAVIGSDGRRLLRCTATPTETVTAPVIVASVTPAAPVATPRPVTAPPTPRAGGVAPGGARPTVARIPAGYRAVWTDGRLNPYRGGRTEAGRQAMDEIWTTSTPRRLVSPAGAAVIPPDPPPDPSRGQQVRAPGTRLSSGS
jgi:hypothetical protein